MTIPAGWAEFNDATSVIRGRLVAATGTFSGTFSADVVDAVDTINIRDGAISAYYGFSFASGSQTASFSIPAQEYASIVDVVVPISIECWGEPWRGKTMNAYAEFYKNDALMARETISIPTNVFEQSPGAEFDRFTSDYMASPQVIRYIDLDVSTSAPVTYRVNLINSSNYDSSIGPGSVNLFEDAYVATRLTLLGKIVVGCRKR